MPADHVWVTESGFTELEQKVIEVLKTIPLRSDGILYGNSAADNEHYRVLYSIAPYVAAAIQAAVAKERDSRMPNQYLLGASPEECALWALGGGVV